MEEFWRREDKPREYYLELEAQKADVPWTGLTNVVEEPPKQDYGFGIDRVSIYLPGDDKEIRLEGVEWAGETELKFSDVTIPFKPVGIGPLFKKAYQTPRPNDINSLEYETWFRNQYNIHGTPWFDTTHPEGIMINGIIDPNFTVDDIPKRWLRKDSPREQTLDTVPLTWDFGNIETGSVTAGHFLFATKPEHIKQLKHIVENWQEGDSIKYEPNSAGPGIWWLVHGPNRNKNDADS